MCCRIGKVLDADTPSLVVGTNAIVSLAGISSRSMLWLLLLNRWSDAMELDALCRLQNPLVSLKILCIVRLDGSRGVGRYGSILGRLALVTVNGHFA